MLAQEVLLQLMLCLIFLELRHNPGLIEACLCYTVRLNFYRMFVIKVIEKACAIVYTIEQLRNDCQTGLQQGCMYLNNLLNALNSADQYVRGYTRSNGTYVRGYYRSRPDGNPYNNYSTRRNINQYRRVYRRIRH